LNAVVDLIPERERPVQPWGDEAPPVPASATRREVRRVHSAFGRWSYFRPWYSREGDTVFAEIDLKDNCWQGAGRGATESEAAWNALQDCITNWERTIAAMPSLVPRFLRRGSAARDGGDDNHGYGASSAR
jgi:hypothetical protein